MVPFVPCAGLLAAECVMGYVCMFGIIDGVIEVAVWCGIIDGSLWCWGHGSIVFRVYLTKKATGSTCHSRLGELVGCKACLRV